jgi:hypothetical protein
MAESGTFATPILHGDPPPAADGTRKIERRTRADCRRR